ncbi:MAG: HAD family phosphatase [Phycisphaerae bacterium]
MFRAVIFDFDGVITDSEIMHLNAFNKALLDYGYQITKEDYFNKYLGLTDADLVELLVEEKIISPEAAKQDGLAVNKKRIFEQMLNEDSNIIDGVPEFLRLLKDSHIAIGICSGALLHEIEFILNKADLQKFFEVIVSAEQVKKGKPAPDGFLLALEKLNKKHKDIRPNECVVIEDSRWGLEAACAAKMHSVAVTNSYSEEHLKGCDIVVNSLRELTIDKLNQICG